jgi:hypothetical protein
MPLGPGGVASIWLTMARRLVQQMMPALLRLAQRSGACVAAHKECRNCVAEYRTQID